MKSVLQDEKVCIVCGASNVEEHHIFHGSYRKNAEKHGMKVYLCPEHHRGTYGVHGREGHVLDLHLKKYAQEYFEANLGTREAFRDLFGKSYL